MRTITIPGNPETLGAIMIPKTEGEFHDHETVRIVSSDTNASVEKTIFRIVDGGEDKWELQFE
ncbi:hypothetical protein FPZ42_18635 [Mucilaginibacter achroorhodeus]|uniref:Uncharacterized protein n=1 Tax=Mucilaginibacter achroorhodeus TaxID=2599294 RepID=A0A563TWR5_9SPHI|nr:MULTISPECIES: hypothetical protein [Mucilaginibacter]QXV65172.1 hypothetical protein INP83_19160 [Mucilaginibacter sp. 21P]TWR23797.1 hypothetical protein FPZ42_18635 [Mucilaginibacter achroorhodeus]